MAGINIDEVIQSIARFSDQRKYWFVRTQGGDYYKAFLENNYVAIGYDSIRLSTIRNAYQNKHAKKSLAEAVKERFPEEQRPGYIGNQLVDFAYNIKKGDIVVIPSESSTYISIGEVSATPIIEVDSKLNDQDCPFLKRKEINWLKKNIPIKTLDAQLLRLKYTQRTVTSIPEDLTSYIDRNIVPLYIKNDNAHLALNVQRHSHLPAYQLFTAWAELLKLADEFGNEEGIQIDKNNFDLRINVQSPGTIEFISYSVIGLVVLSVIIAAIIGAEFETNNKIWVFRVKYKFKTEGLLSKVSDFLDKRQDRINRKNLVEKTQMMDINPDEIVQILKQIKGGNKNEK